MTPTQASLKENENKLYYNTYGVVTVNDAAKFKKGDRVRISRKKKTFEKVFNISKVQHTIPFTYKIKDSTDEEIKGTFYEVELQKTKQEVIALKN